MRVIKILTTTVVACIAVTIVAVVLVFFVWALWKVILVVIAWIALFLILGGSFLFVGSWILYGIEKLRGNA